MIHMALAQIFYKPAIVEKNVDHLAEPGLILHDPCTASLLGILPEDKSMQLQELHSQIRERYIDHIGQKLEGVCREACQIHRPDILVFPEYSVPYQCLPRLKELSDELEMTIVAGTHTVLPSAREYYRQAKLDPDIIESCKGASISPVLFPGKSSDFQVKHDRSIFEVTMQSGSDRGFKRFRAITRAGEQYCFSVVICVDALTLDTAGRIGAQQADPDEDYMLITVACSTRPEAFHSTAELFALREVPMLICNASQYGGTGICLPDAVRERFTNMPGQSSHIGASEEALMLLELSPDHFYVKRGVLDTDVRGSWWSCPILCEKDPEWKEDYLQTLCEIEKSLEKGDIDDAMDYTEVFPSLYEDQLPHPLQKAFGSFRSQLANFCGDPRPYILLLKVALLDIYPTHAHFYNEFPDMIDLCVAIGSDALPQIAALIRQRDRYPKIAIPYIQPTLPAAVTRAQPTEKEDLEFRDRGNYMTQLQEAITDPAVRLILVTGAYGIGKTSTVAVSFKRNLPNWSVRSISLTPTIRFSMVLEYIANAIGSSLKADTLTRNNKKVLKPILGSFIKKLFEKDGRAIVVDQMENIMLGMQGKDHTLLTLFRDAVYSLPSGRGKLIFLSDVRFSKEAFPEDPAVRRIVIGRIPDNGYVKHILEYEMRKRDMIAPGSVPNIPDKLYEIVNGHPLTAKLCIDVMARNGERALENIELGQIQAQIIEQLMKKICLENVEKQFMRFLSVFRTLIDISRLKRYLPAELQKCSTDDMEWLFKLSFISAGDDTLEITAVFRNYYYEQIPEDMKNIYHECALKYYVELHRELEEHRQFSALVYGEIAYHLTCLDRVPQLKEYLPGNVNMLKQLAKDLYQRKKDYSTSLQIYHILGNAYPDDVEVLSYLGRCYARKNDWDKAQKYFEDAIAKASDQGEDTWYLYRDWGHLNVRFYMEEDACEHFKKARKLLLQECGQQDDASILAAEGFLLERSHDVPGAISKYEAALALNEHHEFTLSNYAKLLRRQGDTAGASRLEDRLMRDSFEGLGEMTDTFYSGFDIIDVDTDTYDE